MGKTLLKGGCVLSLDRKVGNLRVGDVLIDDGRIAEVGQDLRARGAEVIDAVDTIVMPGFVDAHRHVADSLFRATGDRSPAPRATLGPEDTYAATLIGLLGAAEAGITTVVDWADATDQGVIDAALQAHADSGLRTVYATGATDSRTRGQGAALTEWASAPREVSEWAAYFVWLDEQERPAPAPPRPRPTPPGDDPEVSWQRLLSFADRVNTNRG